MPVVVLACIIAEDSAHGSDFHLRRSMHSCTGAANFDFGFVGARTGASIRQGSQLLISKP